MSFTTAGSESRIPFKRNRAVQLFLLVFVLLWVSTFIGTSDLNNWFLENVLTFFFLIFITVTNKRYVFSDLSYLLMCIYICLHVYGSKYTYAENPLGYVIQDLFSTSRNHYDRIVHFAFGFILAYPFRELFISWLKYPRTVSWILPVEITLSVGGMYELIEWAVADIFFAEQGAAYLGTQGDIWDAQKDIFLAFLGALIATTTVSLIEKLNKKK